MKVKDWISLTDDKPELAEDCVNCSVTVFGIGNDYIGAGFFDYEDSSFVDHNTGKVYYVTHWFPMPKF